MITFFRFSGSLLLLIGAVAQSETTLLIAIFNMLSAISLQIEKARE